MALKKIKEKTALLNAKIVYFFKETFRFHSREEYREIFSRGLDSHRTVVAFPWLYIRVFFALFVLFVANTLVLRLTDNPLYVPSVTFLGGTAVTVPFIILLYELYPKRDFSMFFMFVILVLGGTAAGIITQIFYEFVNITNEWMLAVIAGAVEEISKAAVAICCILILKQRQNPYVCFLIAAAVGAGFSIIEDMGYIFYYSDKYFFDFHSDIRATVEMFFDRGFSSFCTHVLWTGAIGWAFSYILHPWKSLGFFGMIALSVGLHICWDLPLPLLFKAIDVACCVAVVAATDISIVHLSRMACIRETMGEEAVNKLIIMRAKAMGEQMRYKNAANLTFAIMVALLSLIVLIACAMPIGIDYKIVRYDSKQDFVYALEGGFNLTCDWERAYVVGENVNVEERYTQDEEGKLTLTYAVQSEEVEGYDGVYYYGYIVDDGNYELRSISVELSKPLFGTRTYPAELYFFGDEEEWVFEVERFEEYVLEIDGTVTAVTRDVSFNNGELLLAMAIAACAITASASVVIISLTIKLRRMKDA